MDYFNFIFNFGQGSLTLCPQNCIDMIQEFRFKNFKSFKDEAVFSFEPAKDEPVNRVVVMPDGTKLLRFSVVFGANASGKSNLLDAFEFLHEFWTAVPARKDLSTRVIPFLLDKETPQQDTSFEVKFYIGGVRYWYKLSLNRERVSSESLYFYDSNQPTRVFWREYENGASVVKFNSSVVKLKAAEVDAVNINCWKNMSLFASMSRVNLNVEHVDSVIQWIKDKWMDNVTGQTELSAYAKNKLLHDEAFREYLKSFTKKADLRIEEIEVKEIPLNLDKHQLEIISHSEFIDDNTKERILQNGFINDIRAEFKIRVKNVRGEEEYFLPESSQSDGTNRVMEIESALYAAIKAGAFLAIDEVEASLHPFLLDFILDRFLKEENNESQLLVTTHYDPLLDSINDLFGKDSVWFTEKSEDGSTELFPLTDFKGLNKLSSIRNSYKNGRFGAVPEIYV